MKLSNMIEQLCEIAEDEGEDIEVEFKLPQFNRRVASVEVKRVEGEPDNKWVELQ